jgi:hypothetical protein
MGAGNEVTGTSGWSAGGSVGKLRVGSADLRFFPRLGGMELIWKD